MHKLISLIILLTIFLSGCRTSTEPVPPEKKPPGYQEDVPWASLADSPWPTTFGDAQFTKRSKGIGAQLGIMDKISLPFYTQSGIAIGPDSTIYLVAVKYRDVDTSGLTALSFDGKVKWIYNFEAYGGGNPDPGSPIVADDGTIYSSSPEGRTVYAINPNGTLKWKVDSIDASSFMNLGKDGALYVLTYKYGVGQNLVAIDVTGKIKWKYKLDNFIEDYFPISPNGKTIYFRSGNQPPTITALDLSTQTVTWEYKDAFNMYYSLLMDYQGNIYFLGLTESLEYGLYKLNKNGELLWIHKFYKHKYGALTLDKFGNCIAAYGDTLYSITSENKLNWKLPLGNIINGLISCDAAGSIYLAVSKTFDAPNITYMGVNKEGKVSWKNERSDNIFYGLIFPNAVAFNSTFFISYSDNKIIKIK